MLVDELDEIAWNVMAFFYDDVTHIGRAVYQFRIEGQVYDGFQQDREAAIRSLLDLGWVTQHRYGEVGPCDLGKRQWQEYRVRHPLVEEPEMPAEMLEAARQQIPRDHPAQNVLAQRLEELRERARQQRERDPGPQGMHPPNEALRRNAAPARNMGAPQRVWGDPPPRPAAAQRRAGRRVKYRFIDP